MTYNDRCSIEELLNKILIEISVNDAQTEITFKTSTGEEYIMYPSQNFNNQVSIIEINSDLQSLINSPIIKMFKTIYSEDLLVYSYYTLCTNQASIAVRWYEKNNEIYSENVYFEKVNNEKE